jgi:hypothetical protein
MRRTAIIVSVVFLIVGCAKMNKGVTNTGMRYEIIKEGTGSAPKRGDSVTVHYTGWRMEQNSIARWTGTSRLRLSLA